VALFFAVTLFVSAFLLFLVQPMVGRMVLPLLGGTPAVWATCMVFFQALLLAGYAYAHAATARLGARRQTLLHLVVLALPLVVLGATAAVTGAPIRAFQGLAPQGQIYPFFGVIVLLIAAIGLPFFVVATSAPLLQRWFADTDHPAARDPYFLYAASNLGSLLALVAYPAFVERHYGLSEQGWLWSAGYFALVVLTAGCALRLRHSPAALPKSAPESVEPQPRWADRVRWLALAFVPSSLLLGVTEFLTTDIAPIPLLWVIPLGLYLLTFIIAFGRHPAWLKRAVETAAPVGVLILLFMLIGKKPESWGVNVAVHLAVFLLAALNCHLELARRRPPAGRLTEFYLWVSLGGVLGGLFNALLAPLMFATHTEYPIALVAACLLQPLGNTADSSPSARLLDWIVPLNIAGFMVLLLWLPSTWMPLTVKFPFPWYGPWDITGDSLRTLLAYGVPLLACYFWVERPLRFGLSVAAVVVAGTLFTAIQERKQNQVIYRGRSYFGVVSVEREEDEAPDGQKLVYHKLVHGTTLHGKQQVDPPSDEPLTYYHRTGPIGQVFQVAPPAVKHAEFALVGLGSGSMTAYGAPGQTLTIYEIDPAVLRIAEDPQYFTYLGDCKAKYDVVLGDARLKLADHGREGQYGLIVVDAFSSDAIPVHLLTKEAVELYVSRLAPDGIIALHISNRYLDLEPVAARIAQELGLAGLVQYDNDQSAPGKQRSNWVVLARQREHFAGLPDLTYETQEKGMTVKRHHWKDLTVRADAPLWTDDYSNLLQIFNWEKLFPWLEEQ
jgi:hypothetical protein